MSEKNRPIEILLVEDKVIIQELIHDLLARKGINNVEIACKISQGTEFGAEIYGIRTVSYGPFKFFKISRRC